jgi:hypothetical protein
MPLNRTLTKLSFLLALGLGLGTPGCGLISLSGPSTVAQGKYYVSGNQQFDAFFLELYRLQVRLAEAPNELAKARTDLAQSAGVEPSTPNPELADKLHGALEKLIAGGIRVKIEVTSPDPPDPKAATASLKTSGNPRDSARSLITTIESALTTLVKLRAEMQLAKPRLSELQLLVGQLDGQVDSAFDLGGMSKRREVRRNLQDALKVIPLMTERASEVEAASTELATLVAEKAGTDDGSVGLAPAPAPEPPKPRQPAAAEPRPATPRPASPRPAAPRPAPPPAEPAPAPEKPKAPSKPAEFEP